MNQTMNNKTIAIIGKSTVPKDNPSYIFSKELSYQLVKKGYAIRHGGYAGGIMEAVSDGAARAIKESGLDPNLNTGIPEARFDTDYERTKGEIFLNPSKDICERLNNIILKSDYIVVSPRGGDGTMLELQLAIHENMLGKYTGVIRPIIVCELPEETEWTSILNTQLKYLDNGIQSIDDCPWITVTKSLEETLFAIK